METNLDYRVRGNNTKRCETERDVKKKMSANLTLNQTSLSKLQCVVEHRSAQIRRFCRPEEGRLSGEKSVIACRQEARPVQAGAMQALKQLSSEAPYEHSLDRRNALAMVLSPAGVLGRVPLPPRPAVRCASAADKFPFPAQRHVHVIKVCWAVTT